MRKKTTRPAKRISHSKPDKFDSVRDHIKNGTELSEEHATFYSRASQIFGLLCQGNTEKQVVAIIKEGGWVGQRRAYTLIRDTKKLFNMDPVGASMAAEKRILIEMTKEAYQLAREECKPRDMVAAAKLLADLIGVNNQEGNLVEMYETLALPDIVYTDDPEALFEPEEQGTYEEITEPTKALSA